MGRPRRRDWGCEHLRVCDMLASIARTSPHRCVDRRDVARVRARRSAAVGALSRVAGLARSERRKRRSPPIAPERCAARVTDAHACACADTVSTRTTPSPPVLAALFRVHACTASATDCAHRRRARAVLGALRIRRSFRSHSRMGLDFHGRGLPLGGKRQGQCTRIGRRKHA